MKLHLPVFLRKSLLSCLSAFIVCTVGSGVAWAETLSFEGESLTWDTQTESFTDESGATAAFTAGDNVSFTGESTVTLGEDISAGTVAIEKGAGVTIDLDVFELNVDSIELSGLLDMGYSLHIGEGTTLAVQSAGAVLNSNLVLGEKGVLTVTGDGGSLGGHSLTLQEGASLILTGAVISRESTDVDLDGELSLIVTPTGDGKTYTLLTGVSVLVDKDGNSLTAGSYSIDALFDDSLPGSGFWAGGTLVFAADGTLTLVRHDENVISSSDPNGVTRVTTQQSGGANYQYYKGITFSDIEGAPVTPLSLDGLNRTITPTYSCGAIHGYNDTITLSNNGSVVFERNFAPSCGAAIDGNNSTITLSNNGSVVFEENSSSFHSGGAISVHDSTITMSNNGSVVFEGNTSFADAGAIYASNSTIMLSNNGSVVFERNGNTANPCGAIFVGGNASITLSNNGSVVFEGNMFGHDGGAIFVCGNGSSTLSNNGSVVFEGNSSSFHSGGAIFVCDNGSSTLSNNGSVVFEGNMSGRGGAIVVSENGSSTLSNNGSVVFEGNMSGPGGAILMNGGIFSIKNNASVIFEGNSCLQVDGARLNSIYGYDASNYELVVNLSAPKDGKIEFRDSVHIDVHSHSASVFNLNAPYINEHNQQVVQTGDIIFTGAYITEEVIKELLDKCHILASAEEIAGSIEKSKTSEVRGIMQLHDGRLIIRDGAIMEADGITVHSSASQESTPTLLLYHGTLTSYYDYDSRNAITISGGAALELAGQNVARNSAITMSSGSSLIVNVDNTHTTNAALTLSSSTLTISGAMTLQLNAAAGITDGQSFALITGAAKPTNWDSTNVTVTSGTAGWDVSFNDLCWKDDTLWLYYDSRPDLETATWTNDSADGKWNTTYLNWEQNEVDYEYRDGVAVVFGDSGAGTVTLVGNIAPKSVLVNSTKDYIWVADDTVGGKLTGSMKLTKKGEGTLTINTSNDYTGGTEIKGGTVLAGTATALGTGGVVLNGGTLEIGATGLENSISSSGTSRLQTSASAGITHVLTGTISNTGTLTLSGSFEASALQLNKTEAGRLSLSGERVGLTESGFSQGVEYTVLIVEGGKTVNAGASITHDAYLSRTQLVLGEDGVARAGAEVDYTHYFLTGGDSAEVSKIAEVSTRNQAELNGVTMDSGLLTVDQSITVSATGGSIVLTEAATLGGSIENTAVSSAAGDYVAEISARMEGDSTLNIGGGTITVSGDNSYTGGTTVNGGTLLAGNAQAFGTGDVVVNNASLDLNQFRIANKVFMNGSSTLGYADGASHIVLGSEAAVNFRNGYTLSGGKRLVVEGSASYTGALTLGGGTLELSGLLTVRGDVEFASGTTTTLDISGWKGLDDGDVLVDFGSSNSGYADGCLSLEGIAGDWELAFDAATGVLTLLAVKDEPEIPDTPVEPEKPAPVKLVWAGEKKAVWKVGAPGWENQKFFNNGVEVSFVNGGTVTIEGKVAPGAISVNNHKNLTFKSKKKTPGSISGEGDLTKRGAGTLTLNDVNSSWTGDTLLYAGTIKVKGTTSLGKGDVYLKGGTLNLGAKAIANDIVQSANAVIKSGKKFTGSYTLEKGELQKGSTLNIAKTATLEGGTVNGTLSGNGTVTVTGEVKLGDKGKIKTNALTLGDGAELSTSVKGLNSKSTALCIEEDASLVLSGKLAAASLEVDGGTLKTYASKPVAISVQKDMTLTDAVLATSGKVTANKLTLNASSMSIKGAKAQSLTVKQSLTIGSGSNLILNGKLSTGSLTLKSGATLTMSGSKPVTMKVKGALTLNSGSSIILDYDFVQGKTYKILTFGSLSGVSGVKDLHDVFGVDNENCVFENTGKAITLTVTGKWNPQTQQKAVSAATSEGVVITSAPKSAGNPVADALVQSNWGQLEASRAFVNAMANRSMAVQLGNGERAVWASAIGSSSRHSSAGGHAGADTNVSGGVFGLETQVGRASLFGMALGNSWTRVSAHGFGTIEQDTTHLGLYGQTNWRSGVTADWSAAYGRSDSETMGSDWNQKHLQLDGRMSYNHELNARTVLSPFAGVQYYASDAATVDGTDTGSLQNLRAEIGVAASHRTGKLGVFGEIAVHQDMSRSNPTVSMEGARYTGMNPGRMGINFTIGASYELSDKWSMNASYTGEVVENANAHSANIGATYKF